MYYMYYRMKISNESRLRYWIQTGEWPAEERIIKFTARDISADIREYLAYGAGVCKRNDMFDALAWRVVEEDGTFALRSSRRRLDLDDDEIERYDADIVDRAFWLRELERDAREWRAARDALAYLDAQKDLN